MSIKVRRAYLDSVRLRYLKSTKKDKATILNEFCLVCGYSRKYAIRILRGRIEPRTARPGPKPKYDQVVVHLRSLWESMNFICSKKLVEAIPLWLPFYKGIDASTKDLLLKISPSTVDRLLAPYRKARGLSTTQPSSIKSRIPIKLLDGDVTEPGYVEADTVAHCGNSIQGQYAHTLTMTDLFSGWTETRAVYSKSAQGVLSKVKDIEEHLPFKLLGFACDNGTEFLNEELWVYFKSRVYGNVEFVRRRPYKKNDAAHVEQKNNTHVRELFGYARFEDQELVAKMNEIYRAFWLPLQNHFIPSMKLKSKVRIGGRIKKEYDRPKTPYQRLLECESLPMKYKAQLIAEHKGKNPFYLKQQLDLRLKEFFKLVDERKCLKNTGS